jgi:hypothetical protein
MNYSLVVAIVQRLSMQNSFGTVSLLNSPYTTRVGWIKAIVFYRRIHLKYDFSFFPAGVAGDRKNHYLVDTLRLIHPTPPL